MSSITIGHVAFACGATIAAKEDPTPMCRRAKDGRLVLCVYDSDSKTLSRPQTPQGPADCVHSCPCKRAAGRKQVSAWHEDGRGVGRILVTCHGEWVLEGTSRRLDVFAAVLIVAALAVCSSVTVVVEDAGGEP